jgi:hypothetical protein
MKEKEFEMEVLRTSHREMLRESERVSERE